jgi:imidazolonepropionase-like amidohydrolase
VKPLVIRGGVLFDGTGGSPRENDAIVIEGERITSLAASSPTPDGARLVDATGLSILPGFIDLHVHFGAPVGRDLERSLPLLIWDYARQRPRHRQAFLDAGVTTIRSLGDVVGSPRDILDLKRRAAPADFHGPRVFAAGPLFTAPGGHPAGTIYRGNRFLERHATRQVSSAETARSEVRRLARSGVDGIKAVYDSLGGSFPRLDVEVLQAIVDESHGLGLWVSVHTGSADEVRQALLAGADTIEHGAIDGSLLGIDTIELMRSRGVTYVPTLVTLEAAAALARTKQRPRQFPDDLWRAFLRRADQLGSDPLRSPMENVRAVAAAGVRIGTGTDAQGPQMAFGASLHREQELLVLAGLSPQQALLAATNHAATALHADRDLGTVAVGKLADLVLVAGRPWENIGDVRHLCFVVRGGRLLAPNRDRLDS